MRSESGVSSSVHSRRRASNAGPGSVSNHLMRAFVDYGKFKFVFLSGLLSSETHSSRPWSTAARAG